MNRTATFLGTLAVAVGIAGLAAFTISPTGAADTTRSVTIAPAPVVAPTTPTTVEAPAVPAPVVTASTQTQTAPVAAPVVVAVPAPGPWEPALATDHEPAHWDAGPTVWVGGTSGPSGGAYECWSEYGYPVPQQQNPTCPAGWGGRPPEHPTPVGSPSRLGQ